MHDVTLDVESQNVARVQTHFVGVLGELDAARLASSTHLHLGFDDHGIADTIRHLDRLIDGVGDIAG